MDRCPHCKEVRSEDAAETLFFRSENDQEAGWHCTVCGGAVEFTAKGKAVKA